MTTAVIIALIFVTAFLAVFVKHNIVSKTYGRTRAKLELLRDAKAQFYWQREGIEARFVTFALARLDSNLWIWDEVEFGDEVLIALAKKEGIVYAYIPVLVEMNRPVRRLDQPRNELFFRQLTVIAKYVPALQLWEMTGRAFFNQRPIEVVQERARELQNVDTIGTRAA